MKKAISIIISLAFSACLYFGSGFVHDFAYYIVAGVVWVALIAVLLGLVKDDIAKDMRRRWWLNVPSTTVSILALIFTGHPGMAALSLAVSVLIMSAAFADGRKEAEQWNGSGKA